MVLSSVTSAGDSIKPLMEAKRTVAWEPKEKRKEFSKYRKAYLRSAFYCTWGFEANAANGASSHTSDGTHGWSNCLNGVRRTHYICYFTHMNISKPTIVPCKKDNEKKKKRGLLEAFLPSAEEDDAREAGIKDNRSLSSRGGRSSNHSGTRPEVSSGIEHGEVVKVGALRIAASVW